MLLLSPSTLPQGAQWTYELKLDGYRAIAFKSEGKVHLRSRNDNSFNAKYSSIAQALAPLPDGTVIDGEVVALDSTGRPSFNALQNSASSVRLLYYVFDVLVLKGRDLRSEPLSERRRVLAREVLPKLAEPIREAPTFEFPLPDLIAAVKAQGMEGIVAKRLDSIYEPGVRTGAWQKMRINRGQEFVIAGYTLGSRAFDALVFGYYEGDRLIYVARTRNGFTPTSREKLLALMKPLEISNCPFANLPEARSGRWGQGLTKDKMAECVWLRPSLVGQFEFVEWTPDNHLRHSRFVGLRNDKRAKEVRRL